MLASFVAVLIVWSDQSLSICEVLWWVLSYVQQWQNIFSLNFLWWECLIRHVLSWICFLYQCCDKSTHKSWSQICTASVNVCLYLYVCACVCRYAAAVQDGSQYFVLLIITDGVISDMAQTKEAIVNVRMGNNGIHKALPQYMKFDSVSSGLN